MWLWVCVRLAVLGCSAKLVCGWQCWVALIGFRDYGLKRERERERESQGKRENVKGEKKILKQYIESYSSTFGYIPSYESTNAGVSFG